jgi:UV DNA damage endonuclease
VSAIRFGLCCQFVDAPIRFRTATHRYVWSLTPARRRTYLREIAAANAAALAAAVTACRSLGIGAFRINSQILPLGTHPRSGYTLERLDPAGAIAEAFRHAGEVARAQDVRLSFHPDQFVVLNSERPQVVGSAIEELEFQAGIAELVGADTIVLHGGSGAGGVGPALERLSRGLDRLSVRARSRVALENDDRLFTPAALLPVCHASAIPLVYDVHHHRCLPDGSSVEEATEAAAATWGDREPWTHISSPRDGWKSANPRPHADYIDPADVPRAWIARRMTMDVEAKEKERAVVRLMTDLRARRPGRRPRASHRA